MTDDSEDSERESPHSDPRVKRVNEEGGDEAFFILQDEDIILIDDDQIRQLIDDLSEVSMMAEESEGEIAMWQKAKKKPVEVEFSGPYTNLDTIKTIEGDFEVDQEYIEEHGGYVLIRGVEGEIYPCALDIFEDTYEIPSEANDDDEDSDNEKNRRDAVAYPGGYEVEFKRSIKCGKKMHTVQVRYGEETIGASGENLADALRTLGARLDGEIGGAPYASVVWGSERGEANDD